MTLQFGSAAAEWDIVMTRVRTRLGAVALVATALLALLPTLRANAAVTAVNPSPSSVVAAPDFATDNYGDPWDYNSPDDYDVSLRGWAPKVHNINVADGLLSADVESMGELPLVRGFGAISIPWGRDGSQTPIDATKYNRISLRMKADIPRVTGGQVTWMTCNTMEISCAGGMPIEIKPGWNTYDLQLKRGYHSLPMGWWGNITSLTLMPIGENTASGHIDIDWVRVYQAPAPMTVAYKDSNPGNVASLSVTATPTANDWVAGDNRTSAVGFVGTTGTGSTAFNHGTYPPGTYRFSMFDSDNTTSPLGTALAITPTAATNKLTPDPIEGADYAARARGGDGWDFSQPSDAKMVLNAAVSWSGGLLHGQNAGPAMNDPEVEVPLPTPIDGNRYHHFSMRIWFDGGFSLADTVGGGMNARVYWHVAGTKDEQVSQDILIYPGWQTVNFDMHYPGILDETMPGDHRGWANQQITMVRIDPNEDRGQRNWKLDWVRLGSDNPFGSLDVVQRVPSGLFVAGWSIDPNTPSPTGVHVYVDNAGYAIGDAKYRRDDVGRAYPKYGSLHGFYGFVPASPGVHTVCAYGLNLGAGANDQLGCRRVVVDGSPFGNVDVIVRSGNTYSVAGWAIDPDTTAPTTIHVYVDNVGVSLGAANGERRDVGARNPGYGNLHGFSGTVAASPGVHTVCVYALNAAGTGTNPAIGCRVA